MYLSDIPLDEAWRRFVEALEGEGRWQPLESESISVDRGLGRITAEPMWARRSVPHYHASAMDGYAVRGRQTDRASERTPIDLRLGEQAAYVDTGDALPGWADAVVPIENVEPVESPQGKAIRLRTPVPPWSHVRPLGEDIVATELVVPSGHQLRPADLGALAAAGYAHLLVWRRPRVAIIPTGTELVPADQVPEPGRIPEFNTIMLAAQVEAWGGEPRRLAIVPDDFDRLRAAAASVADYDLVLLNAGSSAGSEDYTARVIGSLGEILVHGIAVRPGHPVVIGMIDRPGEGGAARQRRGDDAFADAADRDAQHFQIAGGRVDLARQQRFDGLGLGRRQTRPATQERFDQDLPGQRRRNRVAGYADDRRPPRGPTLAGRIDHPDDYRMTRPDGDAVHQNLAQ